MLAGLTDVLLCFGFHTSRMFWQLRNAFLTPRRGEGDWDKKKFKGFDSIRLFSAFLLPNLYKVRLEDKLTPETAN